MLRSSLCWKSYKGPGSPGKGRSCRNYQFACKVACKLGRSKSLIGDHCHPPLIIRTSATPMLWLGQRRLRIRRAQYTNTCNKRGLSLSNNQAWLMGKSPPLNFASIEGKLGLIHGASPSRGPFVSPIAHSRKSRAGMLYHRHGNTSRETCFLTCHNGAAASSTNLT